jgi:hypothetical protein
LKVVDLTAIFMGVLCFCLLEFVFLGVGCVWDVDGVGIEWALLVPDGVLLFAVHGFLWKKK